MCEVRKESQRSWNTLHKKLAKAVAKLASSTTIAELEVTIARLTIANILSAIVSPNRPDLLL